MTRGKPAKAQQPDPVETEPEYVISFVWPVRVVTEYSEPHNIQPGAETYMHGGTYIAVEVTVTTVEWLRYNQWLGPRPPSDAVRVTPERAKRGRIL
jgi:hypothetical protein